MNIYKRTLTVTLKQKADMKSVQTYIKHIILQKAVSTAQHSVT